MMFCQHQLERIKKSYCKANLRPAEVPDPRKLPECPYIIEDLESTKLPQCSDFKPVRNLKDKLCEFNAYDSSGFQTVKKLIDLKYFIKSDELTSKIFTDFYGENKSYIGFMINGENTKEEVHKVIKVIRTKGLISVDCYALQNTDLGKKVYELFK